MSWIKKTLETEAKQTRLRVDKWETGIVCSTLNESIPPFFIHDFEVANIITDGILKIYTVMDKAQKAKMLKNLQCCNNVNERCHNIERHNLMLFEYRIDVRESNSCATKNPAQSTEILKCPDNYQVVLVVMEMDCSSPQEDDEFTCNNNLKSTIRDRGVWYYEKEECAEFQSWTSLSSHLPECSNHNVSVEEKSLDSSDGSVIEETPRPCQKPPIPDEDCIVIAESQKSDVDTSDTEEISPVNGDDEQYLDDWSWTMGQANADLESYSDNNKFSANARIAMQNHGFFCVNYLPFQPNPLLTVSEKLKRKRVQTIEETKESKQLKSSDDSDRTPPQPSPTTMTTTKSTQNKICGLKSSDDSDRTPPPTTTTTTTKSTQNKICGLKSNGALKEQQDNGLVTSLPKSLGSTQSPIPCFQPRAPSDNISCPLSTKNDADNNNSSSNVVQSNNIYSVQVEHCKPQIMKYLYQTFTGGTVAEKTADKDSHQGDDDDIRVASSTGHFESTSEPPPPPPTTTTHNPVPLPNTPSKNEIQSTASFQQNSENVTDQSIYQLQVTNQRMKTIEKHIYQSFTNGLADPTTTTIGPKQLNGLTDGQARDARRRVTTSENFTPENSLKTRSRFNADYQLIKTSRESSSGGDNWCGATPLSISSSSIPCYQPRQTVTRTGGGGGHRQSSLSSISNHQISSSNRENATTDSSSASQRKNLYNLQLNSHQMAIIMKHLLKKKRLLDLN